MNALFDESYRLARRFPRKGVISYALGHFVTRDLKERTCVQRANWPHFEKLLLQACLGEPGVLPRAAVLLHWAQLRGWPLERRILSGALNTIVRESAARGYSSEVAWALWAAISLDVRLDVSTGRVVSGLLDDVVALTALHAQSKGLIGGLDTTAWAALMTDASLAGEHWLLAYEAHEQGWLPTVGGVDYIAADPVFAHLRAHDVRFYDTMASLPPLPTAAPTMATVTATYTMDAVIATELPEPAPYE